MRTEGPLRYLIPPRVQRGEVIYIPYLRIKGHLYWTQSDTLHSKVIDTSRPATNALPLPLSLGLRPQAMELRLFLAQGQMALDPNVEFEHAFASLKETFDLFIDQGKNECVYGFISHMNAFVYQPYYLNGNTLYDAITNNKIVVLKDDSTFKAQPQIRNNLSLLPCICPYCGWDLNVNPNSCVAICSNCDSLIDFTLTNMPTYEYRVHEGEGNVYIPFWSIRCEFDKLPLKSYADFIRFFNVPKAVSPDLERKPIYFSFPAIQMAPDVFIRTAKLFTIAQHYKIIEKPKNFRYLPITVYYSSAKEALRVLIWALGFRKKGMDEVLKGLKATILETYLDFYPFVEGPMEYLNPSLNTAILRNALRRS